MLGERERKGKERELGDLRILNDSLQFLENSRLDEGWRREGGRRKRGNQYHYCQ